MKKTVTCLLALFLFGILFFAVSITAEAAAEDYTVSSDGNYKYGVIDESAKTIRLNRCDIAAEDIYIPDEIDGYRVIEIGSYCVMNNDVTKTVHLGRNVQSVLSDAFYGLIKHEAFTVAEDNPYLTVKDSVLYDITGTKLIRCPQFYQTDAFTVTDGVTEICAGAFAFYSQAYQKDGHYYYGYQKIKEIRLPTSLTKIDSSAFRGSYITKLYIPDSVTQVTEWTFAGLDYCKSIYLGAGVSAEAGLGLNSSALQRITVSSDNPYLTVENNVLFNKDKTVIYCYPGGYDDNTTYRIPNGVKTIERKAFNYSNLSSVDFNEVEIIREGAFDNSHVIQDWVVPKTVSSFWNVTNLLSDKTCSFTFLNPDCRIAISWFSFNKYNITIYGFPGSTAEEYVKKNKNTNVTLTFVPLHTSESDADVYSFVHSYAASTVLPTCTEQGYTLQKCSVCGLSYKENYQEPLGHNYVIATAIIPTCTEQGYTIYQCARCGETTRLNYTDPIGHSLTVIEKVEPTCTENGYIKYKCVLCKKTTDEILPANGHSYSVAQKTEPTCTASGYTEYVCSECGNEYSTGYIEPLGHKYATKITPASFVNNGTESVICSQCNSVKSSKTIPKISQVKLKNNSFIYSGKKINGLNTIISNSNGGSISSNEYSIKIYSRENGKEISSPTKIGQYKVTVFFKNHYSGNKDLYFYIKPKTPTVSKLTAGKGKVKVALKKDASVSGCLIVVSENKKFTKNVKSYNVNALGSTKVISLKKKKKYYIKVRSYKIVTVDGKKTKMFSEYTKVKSVKTK